MGKQGLKLYTNCIFAHLLRWRLPAKQVHRFNPRVCMSHIFHAPGQPQQPQRVRAQVCVAALILAAAGAVTGLANAQTASQATANLEGQCILAGRLDSNQRWAPQARGIELMDAAGKRITGSSKAALASVKQARIGNPALLSGCNGNQALAQGDSLGKASKSTTQAVSAGASPLAVQAVGFVPLQVGGELVELRLSVRPDRTIALTR